MMPNYVQKYKTKINKSSARKEHETTPNLTIILTKKIGST